VLDCFQLVVYAVFDCLYLYLYHILFLVPPFLDYYSTFQQKSAPTAPTEMAYLIPDSEWDVFAGMSYQANRLMFANSTKQRYRGVGCVGSQLERGGTVTMVAKALLR
jgi:hypothetical protein